MITTVISKGNQLGVGSTKGGRLPEAPTPPNVLLDRSEELHFSRIEAEAGRVSWLEYDTIIGLFEANPEGFFCRNTEELVHAGTHTVCHSVFWTRKQIAGVAVGWRNIYWILGDTDSFFLPSTTRSTVTFYFVLFNIEGSNKLRGMR